MAKEAGTTLASSTDVRLAQLGQALRRRAAEVDARGGEERVAGKVGVPAAWHTMSDLWSDIVCRDEKKETLKPLLRIVGLAKSKNRTMGCIIAQPYG
jgi:hypothetical protein